MIAGFVAWLLGSSAAMALVVGDKVPDISVPSTGGADVNISQSEGWKIVYFYPKSFTPGCTQQACGLRDSYAALSELGVTVYGVSTDNLDKQNKFKAEYKLPFELLADNDKKLSEGFGVMGMMGFSKRVTFLVNPEGVVTDIIDSVSVGSHDADVIRLLKERTGK
jgi:peroxiredoxin Q/BCP